MKLELNHSKIYLNWLLGRDGEFVFVFGIITGRFSYLPEYRWIHSFRIYLGVFKIEIVWKSGKIK